MNEFVQIKKVYSRTLDPVYIGAGGYRLGRVDNTIIRDPATDVPKIPGTSIAGVVREFYAVYLVEYDENCKSKTDKKEKRKCAEEKVKKIFGDEDNKGILRFYDGQIIFFPISSLQGVVWITTKELLEYWFGETVDKNGEKINIPNEVSSEAYTIKGINVNNSLNLSWLLLEIKNIEKGNDIILPFQIGNWVKRIVLVSEKLFSQIVNDNLEVRTSVRIDSDTGAAAKGALFTYEAIPRGTVIGFETGIDKMRNNATTNDIIDVVRNYFKLLGIGGMGTRGFGRLELASNDNNEQFASQGGQIDDQPGL